MSVRGIEEADILLACSSGGHLFQMLALREAWTDYARVWVTDEASDTRSLLRDEPVVYAYGPTHRDLRNGPHRIALAWIRNALLAVRLIRSLRPRVILTTGAGTTVPFAWIGRVLGCRVVYVESLTRIETPSFSCRLIRPIAHRIYVQWPELAQRIPNARYVGSVLTPR
jgi:UDP-N-acetylglucosamine:LPS N-acetylglucosamine transferase